MEILRIPRTYDTQIEYLCDEDISYIFKNMFRLSNGEVIEVEPSARGGLLKSMWREAVQMENKARAKKGGKGLSYELATMGCDTVSTVTSEKVATKSSQVKPSQVKSNQIVSKDTTAIAEYVPKPITSDINNLIQVIKETCDELGVAYDKDKERMFAKHIMTTKEYGEFCGKINMTREQLAKNILYASVKSNFWKGACTGPMSIYQNYAEVYNLLKQKKEIQVTQKQYIIETDEI